MKDNGKGMLRYYHGNVPPHKHRCKTCRYHAVLYTSISQHNDAHVICDYIGYTGHMRPCPPENCTVYERGKRRRKRVL